jgi:hypothetical protein
MPVSRQKKCSTPNASGSTEGQSAHRCLSSNSSSICVNWLVQPRGNSAGVYRYFVDKGISPLGEETNTFFSHLTSPLVICLQRRANSDISPVHKLRVDALKRADGHE